MNNKATYLTVSSHYQRCTAPTWDHCSALSGLYRYRTLPNSTVTLVQQFEFHSQPFHRSLTSRTSSSHHHSVITALTRVNMGGHYPIVLSVLNLVLLISSTACLYLSSIMINIYLLPYLEVVNSHFGTVPYLILTIGFLLLVFSMFGIAAAGTSSRPALIIYAVAMSIAVLVEMTSIFVSMELRQSLEQRLMFRTVLKTFQSGFLVHIKVLFQVQPGMIEEMKLYWVDEDVKFKWDTLQRDFQCCGALNFKTGYTDWDRYTRDVMLPGVSQYQQRRGVPDTCCLEESPGCGVKDTDIFTDIRAHEKIFTHGCLAVMKERFYRDIAPLLLTFIGCCVALTLLCIVCLVLASAYVASINRKMNYEKDGMGLYTVPMGDQQPGTNRYDETSIHLKTLDSGLAGGGSLRSSLNTPPRTPIIRQGTGSHRASLYIEPTSEHESECI